MEYVMAFMREEWDVDAGLLFRLPKMENYYARLGWQTIDGPVVVDQPSGQTTSPLLVMILPVRLEQWPSGTVNLKSLPW